MRKVENRNKFVYRKSFVYRAKLFVRLQTHYHTQNMVDLSWINGYELFVLGYFNKKLFIWKNTALPHVTET